MYIAIRVILRLAQERISLISLVLSVSSWDGEISTLGATLPAREFVTCRAILSRRNLLAEQLYQQ
jgi:hypothetical protein